VLKFYVETTVEYEYRNVGLNVQQRPK